MEPARHQQSDTVRLTSALTRRWRLVVVFPAVFAIAAFSWASALPKQYEATAVLIAGQGQGLADPSAVIEIEQATQSLATMATDRVVVEAAAKRLDITDDIDTLADGVTSRVPPSTQRIELTVTDTDPTRAKRLANGIATEFSKRVEEQAPPGSKLSVNLWQPASVPKHASSPRIPLITALGLVIGLMVGIGAALLRDHFDERWRSEDDVEDVLGIPVVGSIPRIEPARAVPASWNPEAT